MLKHFQEQSGLGRHLSTYCMEYTIHANSGQDVTVPIIPETEESGVK